MRNTGAILLLLGLMGFFYSAAQLGKSEPLPDGLTVREGLDYPAGRWELARYGCAGVAGIGLLLVLFPKGR